MNTSKHETNFVTSKVSFAVNNANIIVIMGCKYMKDPTVVGDKLFKA